MERGISVVLLFSLLGTSALADEIDFTNQIRPILSKNCYFCHGPDAHERKADLRLDSYEGATEDRDGMRAIDPENLADSEFIHRITSTDPDEIMPTPKSHKKLSSEEIDLLTRWIQVRGPLRGALVLRRDSGTKIGPSARRHQPSRPFYRYPPRGRRNSSRSRGRAARTDPPRHPRPDRAAADTGGGHRLRRCPRGRHRGGLDGPDRSPAGFRALR